ncbi:DUF5946 family protein [Nocardia huaxiensis]|uniref:Uncharacterized protein n=1 Tax=Nocardia huaxiensis TaxID=2755382 RepID=A0A7D6V9Y1_9NOCA|nr:DUF5946 family protein [Nocardia huaxiensis]QLY29971.1 hypothetical protein H0264_32995 [Nocardia huaxiensis]UFS96443.1 DUF5946 family protein [Nocardia huaxiensis]
MTSASDRCPECGGVLPPSGVCADRIPELLEIEAQVLDGSEDSLRAHFYAIATYQVQHPSRMTPQATAGMRAALTRMARNPFPISDLRREIRRDFRAVKVTNPNPEDRSGVDSRWPCDWPITAADIVARPPSEYVAAVTEWARAATDLLDRAVGGAVS